MNNLFVLESECKITTFLLIGKVLLLIFLPQGGILQKGVKFPFFHFVFCTSCITFADG